MSAHGEPDCGSREDSWKAGQVHVAWDRDSQGRNISGRWWREVDGVAVDGDVIREGDRFVERLRFLDDGSCQLLGTQVISVQGAQRFIVVYGSGDA